MSRTPKLTVGLLLIVCTLAFIPQSQAAVEVLDAELDSIIVGGPVSECADCSCPQCYDTVCGTADWDAAAGGFMCKDVNGYLFHEDCNCDGYGFSSPFCHILTSVNCYRNQIFRKDEDYDCATYHQPAGYGLCYHGGHVLHSTTTTTSYDECTETDSDPHI